MLIITIAIGLLIFVLGFILLHKPCMVAGRMITKYCQEKELDLEMELQVKRKAQLDFFKQLAEEHGIVTNDEIRDIIEKVEE